MMKRKFLMLLITGIMLSMCVLPILAHAPEEVEEGILCPGCNTAYAEYFCTKIEQSGPWGYDCSNNVKGCIMRLDDIWTGLRCTGQASPYGNCGYVVYFLATHSCYLRYHEICSSTPKYTCWGTW